ncbi:MAG TPA: 30S ribosomal protein S27e [Candidatus Altiarchaeales archaeon]|nr:30S ribosomal protein S27e [Candidatus Altiarchaeales archaeon]
MSRDTKSRFLKVKCSDCGNEQVIFDSAASNVKCLVCDKTLAESQGGKAKVLGEIVEVLDQDLSPK